MLFENKTDRNVHTGYYLPQVQITYYKLVHDEKNFFNQPIKNDKITYDNIQKISTGQRDNYTTECLLYYSYFKEHYKVIATDLSKQQKLDTDPKAKQQINFTGKLEQDRKKQTFFITKETKETVLNFSKGAARKFYDFNLF